jgi:N6-adenosine-specific RNA methylase IME4
VVYEQDLELDNASADATMLDSLAAMTGGQSLAPEELPALLERLAKETESLEVQTETKKTLWDTWPFMLAFVGLLAVEWYLRKRWGLV